jgi:hypothetical protein
LDIDSEIGKFFSLLNWEGKEARQASIGELPTQHSDLSHVVNNGSLSFGVRKFQFIQPALDPFLQVQNIFDFVFRCANHEPLISLSQPAARRES